MLDLLSSHFSILSREVSLPCAKIEFMSRIESRILDRSTSCFDLDV